MKTNRHPPALLSLLLLCGLAAAPALPAQPNAYRWQKTNAAGTALAYDNVTLGPGLTLDSGTLSAASGLSLKHSFIGEDINEHTGMPLVSEDKLVIWTKSGSLRSGLSITSTSPYGIFNFWNANSNIPSGGISFHHNGKEFFRSMGAGAAQSFFGRLTATDFGGGLNSIPRVKELQTGYVEVRASATQYGVVKIGWGLLVTNGVLSVDPAILGAAGAGPVIAISPPHLYGEVYTPGLSSAAVPVSANGVLAVSGAPPISVTGTVLSMTQTNPPLALPASIGLAPISGTTWAVTINASLNAPRMATGTYALTVIDATGTTNFIGTVDLSHQNDY
jgi:hypothetical protein